MQCYGLHAASAMDFGHAQSLMQRQQATTTLLL